ncbi:MAG: chemotaxis protein CheB [Gemmatimonadaceae bacterium]|nr:chemotaxis protein CheB [Acetobacteraceae bacterium]
MEVRGPVIVVVGASVGGVTAIQGLASALPADFDAAVFVVLHIGAHKSELPWLLNQHSALPAHCPVDREPIEAGRIYVAPPDHHMMIEPGIIRLNRGPRENWARPAIDPLFRSAAAAYGPGVIGVILTGGLNDGTAGLHAVKQHGGATVVQDPAGAADPSMPRSALRHVVVDHCVTLAELPATLGMLVDARTNHLAASAARQPGDRMTADYKLDRPLAITCPDCGGALRPNAIGTLQQFSCHIGHVYSAEVLVAAQFAALEWSLEAALRAIGERAELCRQRAGAARDNADPATAAAWDAANDEAIERTAVLHRLLGQEWMHPGETETPADAATPRGP